MRCTSPPWRRRKGGLRKLNFEHGFPTAGRFLVRSRRPNRPAVENPAPRFITLFPDHAVQRTAATSGAFYAALPAAPHSEVTVRIFDHDLEILDAGGSVLRRHAKTDRKGAFVMKPADRLFNPSRDSARVLAKAERIGPCTAALAQELFARLGRPSQRALYGLANLARHYPCADIEAVCARLLQAQIYSYAAVKQALQRKAALAAQAAATALAQTGAHIRPLTEYQAFWDTHSRPQPGR